MHQNGMYEPDDGPDNVQRIVFVLSGTQSVDGRDLDSQTAATAIISTYVVAGALSRVVLLEALARQL